MLQRIRLTSSKVARQLGKHRFLSTIAKMDLVGPRDERWFTGKNPMNGKCPGVLEDGRIYSLPLVNLHPSLCSKESLQNYFDNTWAITEVLFAGLQGEEAFTIPPYHGLRHPLIFYYGHPAVFYINKLRVAGLLKEPLNARYEALFETGVDEMLWDDMSKNEMKWPSVPEVHNYRKRVHETVSKLIQSLSDEQVRNITPDSPLWALVMCFEHERIHIETSSVLFNELPLKYLRSPEFFPQSHNTLVSTDNANNREPKAGQEYPVNEMIHVPAQRIEVGKPRNFPSFGWDNEYGQRTYEVPEFRASKFMISNGEFLEFVQDAGYARKEFWTEVGWKWRAFRNCKWPTFWIRDGPQGLHSYYLRLIFNRVDMNWSHPVSVNFHEAQAFTKWKSIKTGKRYRVMTELEHRAIRDPVSMTQHGYLDDPTLKYPVKPLTKDSIANVNMVCGSSTPVNALRPNSKGFHDVTGNAWEWNMDYFCALPGFEIHPYYEDFSTPCFDGEHNVIMGGSFISTGDEASHFARFHFRPHFFQHAGFRVVEELALGEPITSDTDAPGPHVGSYPFRQSSNNNNKSRSNRLMEVDDINMQVSKHFGHKSTNANLPHYSTVVKDIITQSAAKANIRLADASVLEVGCGIGGLLFELQSIVKHVEGIDHDVDSIETAKKLTRGESVSMKLASEGELTREVHVEFDKSKVSNNMRFRQASAACLPAEIKDVDIVVLNHVVEKIPSPKSLLGRMKAERSIVKRGGLVVLLSGFGWDANTTPKSLWLGGKQGEDKSGCEAVMEYMADDYDLLSSSEIAYNWRVSEHDTKGKIAKAMVFKRK